MWHISTGDQKCAFDLAYPENIAFKLMKFDQILGNKVCKVLNNEDLFSKLENVLDIEKSPTQEVDQYVQFSPSYYICPRALTHCGGQSSENRELY